MATKKKLLQAAAGGAGGAGLDVSEVFSTYLYTGNDGSNRDISNGIDLSTEGGMVWWRPRDNTDGWGLIDTERGAGKNLRTHGTFSEYTDNGLISAFNTDGYRIGGPGGSYINSSSNDYVSFSFRKAPKFFDVVTYTGTGSAQNISHNLGSVPAMIIVKATDISYNWAVYHKDLNGGTNPEDYYILLNSTAAEVNNSSGAQFWGAAPTSTEFTVGGNVNTNRSGYNYVAYLFAHNNGDGEFGPDSDQDIIKCGSYTGNSNGEYDDNGVEVNLGFEPQWIMIKASTWGSGQWQIFDTMRGLGARTVTNNRDNPTDERLFPNQTWAQEGYPRLSVTPRGFKMETDNYDVNASIHDYIYVAIRRGPMAVPESATDVFHANEFTTTAFTEYTSVGFAPDLAVQKAVSGNDNWEFVDKLRGPNFKINSNSSSAEGSQDTSYLLGGFLNDGVKMGSATNGQFNGWNPNLHYYWKRAPNFFDMVTYVGTGANRTVNHNLGVAPEMMWIKQRNTTKDWCVYHKEYAGTDDFIYLNYTNGTIDYGNFPWNSTAPTSSVFSLSNNGLVNTLNGTYIAYLFASLDGISKVGSYTGTGSAQNIDCGFSAGARFVLIKDTTSASPWTVVDSERGISSSGYDPTLELNTNSSESSTQNNFNVYSSGFGISTGFPDINTNGNTYIFYAIA